MIAAGLSLGSGIGSLAISAHAADLPLGINVWNLAAQAVTFFIVLLILAKWVFPIFTKTMDQRARVIQEGVENTERSRVALVDAERRVEALVEEARQQSQQTLTQATQAGERLRAEIEQEATQRGREIVAQAEKRIEQEIAQAKAELRTQVADLAISAAEQVIGSSMDDATNRRLVNEFVAQSRELQC
jgi:F-type H+-transporting ATPase subunit b